MKYNYQLTISDKKELYIFHLLVESFITYKWLNILMMTFNRLKVKP